MKKALALGVLICAIASIGTGSPSAASRARKFARGDSPSAAVERARRCAPAARRSSDAGRSPRAPWTVLELEQDARPPARARLGFVPLRVVNARL
jgi:hypothetical protein